MKEKESEMKAKNPRVRLLLLGYPKAGKTGALAALVNSGRYKLRILDFDHNPDPLYAFVKSEFYDRVSIVTLQDTLRDNGKRISVARPEAFANALKALDHWVDDEGNDYGSVKEWGDDVILVMDSLTSMGEAAFRRRRACRPSGTNADDQQSDWKCAMDDQNYMMEMLAQTRYNCHVIALSHIKMIEPKILAESTKDTDDIRRAKAEISRKRAEGVDIRWCPSALGNTLPPEIARHFPAVVLVDGSRGGKRKIVTKGEQGLDLGVPAAHISRELPLETGLLSVFDAILENQQEESEDGKAE